MFNHTETYELLNIKNDAFGGYCFWAGILVLKMFFMSIITAVQRTRQKVIICNDAIRYDDHSNAGESTQGMCSSRCNKQKFLNLRNALFVNSQRQIGFCKLKQDTVRSCYNPKKRRLVSPSQRSIFHSRICNFLHYSYINIDLNIPPFHRIPSVEH